jgi:Zinc-finger domain
VFLNMGAADEIVCPYCSTLYLHSMKLAAGEAMPEAAVWHEEAA